MALNDVAALIAALSTAGLLVCAVMTLRIQSVATSSSATKSWIKTIALSPFVLAMICCCGVGYDLYDRSFRRLPDYMGQQVLADGISRLEVQSWIPAINGDKVFVNGYTINKGVNAISSMQHLGLLATSNSVITDDQTRAIFNSLKAQLWFSKESATNEIPAGSEQTWFSIPSPVKPADWTMAKTQYIFNTMRYRDVKTPQGMHVYTESCLYYLEGAIHKCESGHNNTYISPDIPNLVSQDRG